MKIHEKALIHENMHESVHASEAPGFHIKSWCWSPHPPPHPKSPTFTTSPPLPFDPLPPHLQDNFAHPNQDWGPVINDPR